MLRFVRELVAEILGELGFRIFVLVWVTVWVVGLALLGVPLGYEPKYGVIVGGVIGIAVPLWWWIKRQIAEQRRLSED
ncbi:MAG: hypothetical protein AAGD14_19550 [Planctomycetota bacterium]